MDCVYCGSGRVIKYGTRSGVQQYRCKMCGRQFNERSGTPFAGMRYTPGEVVLALRLRFNYRLSCREVSELMAEMGHPVSPATVLLWTGRVSDTFQMLQRRYRPDYPGYGMWTSATSGSGAGRATSMSWRTRTGAS